LSDAATEFKTCPAQQKEDLAWEIGCMYTAIETEQDTIQVDQLCNSGGVQQTWIGS